MAAPKQMSMGAEPMTEKEFDDMVCNPYLDCEAPKAPEQMSFMESVAHKLDIPHSTNEALSISSKGLHLVHGYLCAWGACYCNCPRCWGCSQEGTVLCFQIKNGCQKCMYQEDPNGNKCFLWCQASDFLLFPTRCLEFQFQYFCCVGKAAFPCTEDVPCVLGLYGLICFVGFKPVFKCCPTLAQAGMKESSSSSSSGKDNKA